MTGCAAVGPDFKTADAPVSENFIQRNTAAITKDDPDTFAWWQLFEDPILNQLIEMAYAQNLSLQIAGLRVLEARAQLGIAAGNWYPQSQEINGDFTWVNQPSPAENFRSYTAGFDVAWEMDFWGKFRRGIESAQANLLASVASYDDFLVTLTAEVARSYMLIRTLEERIRIAQENVDLQMRSVQMVEARFQFGAVTELDVQQARTLLYSTHALIPRFQLSLNQTRHAIAILLGMPPEALGSMLEGPTNLPVPPATIATGMPADLLRRRPDVRQAELQAAALGAQIGVAQAELYPSFSLFGTLGWSATDIADASLGDPGFGAGFGPAFRWPIFNYGRIRNRVRVADARFEQALITYQNAVLNAAREVEDAMTGFYRSKQLAELLSKSVDAAKRSTQIAMLQYKEGLANYTRVLDSTRSLTAQQDQFIQARGDTLINMVAIYKALGGGWQLSKGDAFVPFMVQERMKQRTKWGDLIEISHGEQLQVLPDDTPIRRPDW
jgi:NodT family efflux transporter outer membrane factor (OMF) lipoprotein